MSNEPKNLSSNIGIKKDRVVYTAHQRAQAVLSVWTERRRPSEVCQELGINSIMLAQWQDRAMDGMLRALEPRSRPETQRGPVLTEKLEQMLSRRSLAAESKLAKLDRRLRKLQQPATAVPAPTAPKEK